VTWPPPRRRPYAGRRRCHGHPGFRADEGRLTVTPQRSSRLYLPQPKSHRTTSRTRSQGWNRSDGHSESETQPVGSRSDRKLGACISFAIALHNTSSGGTGCQGGRSDRNVACCDPGAQDLSKLNSLHGYPRSATCLCIDPSSLIACEPPTITATQASFGRRLATWSNATVNLMSRCRLGSGG
jgi:hypothetical protein